MQEGKAEFSLTFLSRPLIVAREELLRALLLRIAEDRLGRALLDDAQFDHVVVNDDLEKAQQEVYQLVKAFLDAE